MNTRSDRVVLLPDSKLPSVIGGDTTRPRLPLAATVAFWALWGVWTAQQSALAAMVSGQSAPLRGHALPLALVSAAFWALLTPLLMVTTRQIRDRIARPVHRVLTHLVVLTIVHLTDAVTYWMASDVVGANPRPLLPLLFSLVTFNALAYIAIAGIVTALDSQHALRAKAAREDQLETQLALAQFHALRAQLQPHFLFNALNAISSLIHSDPARADRMLARVSELLRLAIDTATESEVTLQTDVAFAQRYLEIEQMRYGDRLDVRTNVRDETLDALVPSMLLQPLVENAVRHGIAPYARHGCVEIRASRSGDALRIVVRDTGAGFDTEDGTGVGIRTTRGRLATLYGASHEMTFAHGPDGFEARVQIPFRWREPEKAPASL